MKFKNILRIITLIILSIYIFYCAFTFVFCEISPKYLDCRNVISKSSDEVVIKHGVRTELYLNIQFKKSGFRSIECEPTVYFSKKVGDDVCFYLYSDTSIWYELRVAIGGVSLMILCACLLVLFINFLIPESWWI